ncbi:MAG: ATP-grasp domain-containing protein [Myxococcota bacterium]
MKTVLVLGASALQTPLVRAARDAGHRVLTADNVPSNPAHAAADAAFDVSTRDVAQVVDLARREAVDAVVSSCSDVALPALAATVEALDLPGVRPKTLELWHPKAHLRRLQADCGLPCPDFVAGPPSAKLVGDARSLGGDLVVKPTDRSGSRGVRCVRADAPDALERAIEEAAAIGFEGEVIVERFIEGVEHGGDAWIAEGRVSALFVTDKRMQGAIVRGHAMPSRLDAARQDALRTLLERHCQHAGYRDGPVNFDVRIGAEGPPILLELAPRLGGNWIPQLAAWSRGVDLFGATIAAAIGEAPVVEASSARAGASFVLAAGRHGILERDVDVDAVGRAVPALVHLELDVAAGDPLEALRDSGQQIGRALFDLDVMPFEAAAEALERSLSRWIVPTGSGAAEASV